MSLSNRFLVYNPKNFKFLFILTCWIILFFSTSQFNFNVIHNASAQSAQSCTANHPISGVTANGNDAGQPPSNVLDNNRSTRWSNLGIGSWIRADLGATKNICSVDIAWLLGNERRYNFVIATSTDGTTFTTKFTGTSSGTTLSSERYSFTSTNARYVKVTVNGNTANNYAHIAELDVLGPLMVSPSFTFGLTYSGSVP